MPFEKMRFLVTGMTCAACSAHVEKSVSKLSGVRRVEVNLLAGTMSAELDREKVSERDIIAAVTAGGYGAEPLREQVDTDRSTAEKNPLLANRERQTQEISHMKARWQLSLCFLAPLMVLSMQHMLGYPLPSFFLGRENALIMALSQLLLTLPIVYINRIYYQKGLRSLLHGSPNMDSLVAIGSGAALIYGIFALYRMGFAMGRSDWTTVEFYAHKLYFESAGMLLTLITIGKFLETRSKGKTGDAVLRLMELTPPTATVLREGEEKELPAQEILVGDILIIRPGEKIPVDGVLMEGNLSLDQSAMTGESLPVERRPGEVILSASVNRAGFGKMRAQKVGRDTALSQIIRLVEEAGGSKAPIARLADKISGIFVPTVIGIALLTALVWLLAGQSAEFALNCAISVLVISCPCALGLATPVAIMVGTGKGAEYGILMKSAEALEQLHRVNTVVLDKTGTVTEGKPAVTDVVCLPNISAQTLFQRAISLERPSEHPLAKAVVQYIEQHNAEISEETLSDFLSTPGRGVSGVLDHTVCRGGNRKMMEEAVISVDEIASCTEQWEAQGKTVLYFSEEHHLLGAFALADTVKPTSASAVEALQKQGIEVILLTGDHPAAAEHIRSRLSIDRAMAEVLPAEKEAEIRRLQKQGKTVAMVGDGVNDAPALTAADVGIAIGAGTDIAMESADIVLMKNDLRDVVTAISLGRAVLKNIKENLFWAFFYNCIGITLAAGVYYPLLHWQLNPMIGAAAMSLSSVCVVSNALRLRRFRPKAYAETPAMIYKEIKEEKTMKKIMKIDGMMCCHCQARVQKALSELPNVTEVVVDLEQKQATITANTEISDEALTKAVTDAGYTVLSVK